MTYSFKRALGMSLLLYIATFIVGIVAGIICGQDMSSMSSTPDWFWYIGMAAAVVLMVVFAMLYFKNGSVQASAQSGLYFGLTAIVISLILDFALFSLGNSGGANVDLSEYYGDFRYWIIMILVIGTATIVGSRKASAQ